MRPCFILLVVGSNQRFASCKCLGACGFYLCDYDYAANMAIDTCYECAGGLACMPSKAIVTA